jgi:protein involved in polysaccharide export with SLBB domain
VKNVKNKLLLIIFILFAVLRLNAQLGNLPTDLSKVKVEVLSDEQVGQLIEQMEKNGISQDQLEQMAAARGMRPEQIRELRKRIEDYKNQGSSIVGQERARGRLRTYGRESDSLIYRQRAFDRIADKEEGLEEPDFFEFLLEDDAKEEIKLEDKIFGFNLFRNEKISFQPGLNIPTPVDYQLGHGDELIIDIWGVAEMTYTETISPEGSIIIPGIGPVYLSGLTIENAKKKLRSELGRIYAGLNQSNPNIFLNISLGNVRSINVNMVGEVFVPGTYTLPSMANVFTALYAAGGPTINGSLRYIKVTRNNKVIANLDLYQFLMNGTLEGNIRLQDQDVVFIEPYYDRVEVIGEIKRPGIYEMKNSETLSDLIRYSGGFSGKAYKTIITTTRFTDRERKVIDTPAPDFDKFVLQDGDFIQVDSILNKYENRVEISGAVYRPGSYSVNEGQTLADLIKRSDGLREDAFPNRGVIYRQKEDMSMEVIPFDRTNIEEGGRMITLRKEDLVIIPSIFDLREEFMVEILGEVRKPGKYPFAANATAEDLIVQAGGLLESASMSKLEIARRIKNPNSLQANNKVADIFQFPISQGLGLSTEGADFKLEPFDIVFIRRSPGYQTQKIMHVEGEVNFSGDYSLSEQDERISSIISRSGGLTSYAYPQGARLVRRLPEEDKSKVKIIQNLAQMAQDTAVIIEKEEKTETTIGIDLVRILAEPGSKYDIFIEEGDRLIIPKQLQTVNLQGAVLYATTVRYDERLRFSDYISRAGGFTQDARRKNSYIIYPNGSVDKTKNLVFFNNFPTVEPGSEIYVPIKEAKRKLSTAETISIFSATASMSLVIVTLINSLK